MNKLKESQDTTCEYEHVSDMIAVCMLKNKNKYTKHFEISNEHSSLTRLRNQHVLRQSHTLSNCSDHWHKICRLHLTVCANNAGGSTGTCGRRGMQVGM